MSNKRPQLSEDDVGHWPPASAHIFTHLYAHMNMYTHKNRYAQLYAHSPICTHTQECCLSLSSFLMAPFTLLIVFPKATWAAGPYQPVRVFPLTPEWHGCPSSAALLLSPAHVHASAFPLGREGNEWAWGPAYLCIIWNPLLFARHCTIH